MRRSHLLVIAAVALTAGCGTTAPAAAPEVATLASTNPTATASAKNAAQRPRERIDMTDEELAALRRPYDKCMQEHDPQPKATDADTDADAGPRPATAAEMAKDEAANRICEPLYLPLPPWEKDPANPEARDFAVAVVKCLKEHGVEQVEVSDDGTGVSLGGGKNDKQSINRGMELAPQCERDVAAKRK